MRERRFRQASASHDETPFLAARMASADTPVVRSVGQKKSSPKTVIEKQTQVDAVLLADSMAPWCAGNSISLFPAETLLPIGQREDVKRLTGLRNLDSGATAAGTFRGTATTQTRRHGDVLLAAGTVGNRKALRRGAEPRLPKHLARSHIVRAHRAIDVTNDRDTTGSRDDAVKYPARCVWLHTSCMLLTSNAANLPRWSLVLGIGRNRRTAPLPPFWSCER